MKLQDIIPNDPLLEDISRRGFLKGAGVAALSMLPSLASAGDREQALEVVTRIAGSAWDMRRLGWSRSMAMDSFENKMGYSGESLKVAAIVCNFAWSFPKDHYTRNEFIQIVKQQASDNMPRSSTPKKSSPSPNSAGGVRDTPNLRQQNLDRIAKPSAGYGGRIKARIMPNIVGNPAGEVSVEIKSSSDGTIIGSKLVKSSGDLAWDNAVLKGISKTEVLPRDTDGNVPQTINITF